MGAPSEQWVVPVLSHYDLGHFRACWRVKHGYVNETWIVQTTTGRYVLRRRHPSLRQPPRIVAQHALIRHLYRVGFPAPEIVPTRHGETFLELGSEIYEVQKCIPGVLCDRIKPAHRSTAARTLAWYHTAVKGFDHPAFHLHRQRYGPGSLVRTVNRLCLNGRGQCKTEAEELLGRIREHVRQLEGTLGARVNLPALVIHGDYYAENLLLRGNVVVGVVDYDQAHWCWRATEMAEALIYFACERSGRYKHIVYSGALDLDLVRQFLSAYMEVAELADAEIRALPELVRVVWMCASLCPPMRARLRLDTDLPALSEVLSLADWAQTHSMELVEAGFAARSRAKER